ncbi:MAG: hypothetical protein ABFC73_08905 [Clostridiaceae bacterium]
MGDVHIEGNQFHDHSELNVTVNNFSDSDWRALERDIAEARKQTSTAELIAALNKLEREVKRKSRPGVAAVIGQFASMFTSTLFANIASSLLMKFVSGFLG